ncbi:hypothetical protein KBZ15_01290 [Cyanobium sp. BA20m-p-22]|uniref:hypothetical protein n=1 Tax=Cyanobium sp. BA20m-p-22 TaxID=2823704 RepID=UPI0020CD71D8|nr:hypothetical protein [Cyanobium sp. BA20m-p-22]MCP9908552.1 hypothetical protein [Cyanobium sp. BA20m-p-22]
MPARLPHHLRIARLPLIALLLAGASAASATPLPCSNATLKGTYLYNESGVLNGKPYAESGREVYDGQGGIVLSYRGSDGSGGVEKATYRVSADCIGTATYPDGQKATSFISPDGSRFVYTITAAPGSQPTALSGSEVRVAP